MLSDTPHGQTEEGKTARRVDNEQWVEQDVASTLTIENFFTPPQRRRLCAVHNDMGDQSVALIAWQRFNLGDIFCISNAPRSCSVYKSHHSRSCWGGAEWLSNMWCVMLLILRRYLLHQVPGVSVIVLTHVRSYLISTYYLFVLQNFTNQFVPKFLQHIVGISNR